MYKLTSVIGGIERTHCERDSMPWIIKTVLEIHELYGDVEAIHITKVGQA